MSGNQEVTKLKSKLHAAAVATENGDFDTARAIAFEILNENAGNLAALHIYFDSTKIKTDDPIFENLANFCRATALPKAIQSQLQFMYGKALSDQGRFEEAFHAFVNANALSGKTANPNATASLSNLLIKSIKDREIPRLPIDKTRLIFVLGMPRSGTSIMSQSLGCHSQIMSLGERVGLGEALDRAGWTGLSSDSLNPFLDKLDRQKLEQIRNDYLDGLGEQDAVYVDKMPENYWFAWIIPHLFPNAKIVHMKRPPLANCWSCFRRDFKDGHHYSYNFKTMMAQYAIYAEMVLQWRELAPESWHEVNLDDFAEDTKTQLLPILNHFHLDWQDACLSPEKNTGSVSTLSKWQVRQGLNVKISKAWENYLPFIQKTFLK